MALECKDFIEHCFCKFHPDELEAKCCFCNDGINKNTKQIITD